MSKQPPADLTRPHVGDQVHYVSYGTPGGEYTSRCRAAFVTEVGQWVTVETTPRESYDKSEGRPIRHAEQWFYSDAVALCVLNPTGVFFGGGAGPGTVACLHNGSEHTGGTWHWVGEGGCTA